MPWQVKGRSRASEKCVFQPEDSEQMGLRLGLVFFVSPRKSKMGRANGKSKRQRQGRGGRQQQVRKEDTSAPQPGAS